MSREGSENMEFFDAVEEASVSSFMSANTSATTTTSSSRANGAMVRSEPAVLSGVQEEEQDGDDDAGAETYRRNVTGTKGVIRRPSTPPPNVEKEWSAKTGNESFMESLIFEASSPNFSAILSDVKINDPCTPPSKSPAQQEGEKINIASLESAGHASGGGSESSGEDEDVDGLPIPPLYNGDGPAANHAQKGTVPETPVSLEGDGKFRIVNKDSGETFDIRELLETTDAAAPLDVQYSLFPSRKELLHDSNGAPATPNKTNTSSKRRLKRGKTKPKTSNVDTPEAPPTTTSSNDDPELLKGWSSPMTEPELTQPPMVRKGSGSAKRMASLSERAKAAVAAAKERRKKKREDKRRRSKYDEMEDGDEDYVDDENDVFDEEDDEDGPAQNDDNNENNNGNTENQQDQEVRNITESMSSAKVDDHADVVLPPSTARPAEEYENPPRLITASPVTTLDANAGNIGGKRLWGRKKRSSGSSIPSSTGPQSENPLSLSKLGRSSSLMTISTVSSVPRPPVNSVAVKCVNKPPKNSEFDPMLLTRTIPNAHNGAVWCMGFSQDGKYLATGGEDGTVAIWEVAPKPDQDPVSRTQEAVKKEHPTNTEGNDQAAEPNGHTETIKPKKRNSKCDWRGDYAEVDETSEVSLLGDDSFRRSLPGITHGSGPALGTEIKFLSTDPIRRYTEHTGDVVDFSWSHSNFLLSASLDKTVRLWHPSRPICLHIFQHSDLVTSVAFHPSEDGFFLSGGFDKKLRIWSIPEGRVREWAQAPEVITTARYVPGGRFVVAGLLKGQVYFYSSDKLVYHTQISCRNRHGSQRDGKKVTGITFLRSVVEETNGSGDNESVSGGSVHSTKSDGSPVPNKEEKRRRSSTNSHKRDLMRRDSAATNGSNILTQQLTRSLSFGGKNQSPGQGFSFKEQMLVTTNDSRLRLYGLDDYCMIRKYKGLVNASMQIRARFSESGDYIVCGSEGGSVHIWNTAAKGQPLHLNVGGTHNYDRSKAFECFEACKGSPPIVTDTVFIPSSPVKKALMLSGLFPTLPGMNHIEHDMSGAAIITSDYEGTIRVFFKKAALDAVIYAAGPEGMCHKL